MKKRNGKWRAIVLLLAGMMAFGLFGCQKDTGDGETLPEEPAAGQETGEEETAPEEEADLPDEGDPEDPANADPTDDVTLSEDASEMERRYTGVWTFCGIRYWEGSFDESVTGTSVYRIYGDGTYEAEGDENGTVLDEKGTWTLNEKNKLVAGDAVMGIDSEGYLLKSTGERDGKGRKLNYAYRKVD